MNYVINIRFLIKKKVYLINKTESPAKSLFPLTNRLQPVVSKWRFGCPASWNTIIICYV